MKRLVTILAIAGALAITGCTSTATTTDDNSREGQTTSYAEDIATSYQMTNGSLLVSVPESWEVVTDSPLVMTPSVGGFMQINSYDGIDFTGDGLDEVDDRIDELDDDAIDFSNEKIMSNLSNSISYKVEVTSEQDGENLVGYADFVLSGHEMHVIILCVPKDAFDNGYDEVVDKVIGSIALVRSQEPMGAESDQAEADAVSDQQTVVNNEESSYPASFGEGTYRVGVDIEAGEYRLTATTSVPGYWAVTNSSAPDASIIGNDNFNGSTYVTVQDGQYLELSRCLAEKV